MAKAKKSPLATPAQIAAQDFEPVEFDMLSILSLKQLNDPSLISLKIAAVTITKTKAELVEVVRSLGGDRRDGGDLAPLITQLQITQTFLKHALAVLSAAEMRLMIATHVAVGPSGW